jgi:hypothetical protein
MYDGAGPPCHQIRWSSQRAHALKEIDFFDCIQREEGNHGAGDEDRWNEVDPFVGTPYLNQRFAVKKEKRADQKQEWKGHDKTVNKGVRIESQQRWEKNTQRDDENVGAKEKTRRCVPA